MLQNRVDPWGGLHAVANRGTLMGNRGILHDDANRIVKQWAHKGWVTCLLAYKTIKRPKPFSKSNYSELFFLDEATAFAAGHRPCATCQRDRYGQFKDAWIRANMQGGNQAHVPIGDIDKALHVDRTMSGGAKCTFQARLGDLPVGTFVELRGSAYLKTVAHLLPWSFSGYGKPAAMDAEQTVTVLTPESTVRAFAAGFVPNAHASASASA
jgi:hypothetical protein